MKKIFLGVLLFFVPSFPAYGQNCGQGQVKTLYLLPVVLGMDEAQGGSQVLEDGRVINGYDFQFKLANLSDQSCGVELGFSVPESGGEVTMLDYAWADEGAPINKRRTSSFFQLVTSLRPAQRRTVTVIMAPSATGFHIGWAYVNQEGASEKIVSVGTVRLYQSGAVISQFGMLPVEAKLTNFVQAFAAKLDQQRTGFAIGNPYHEEVKVKIQLLKDGPSLGLGVGVVEIGKKEEVIPLLGYYAKFINEIFPEIENDPEWQRSGVFNGLVKITSSKEVPVSAIDGRVSEGRFLMSTVGAK